LQGARGEIPSFIFWDTRKREPKEEDDTGRRRLRGSKELSIDGPRGEATQRKKETRKGRGGERGKEYRGAGHEEGDIIFQKRWREVGLRYNDAGAGEKKNRGECKKSG